jgi:hypothetical protein
MNLKKFNCDMACFSLFVDVVYNKHKHVKPPWDIHKSKVAITMVVLTRVGNKYRSMALLTIIWITSFNELSFARKHNSITLMKHNPF